MAAPGASDLVVVVTGGDPVDPAHVRDLPAGVRVVAADSGVDHAYALGLVVDLAIGDFDSVSPAGLARAAQDGAVIERHPVAKDATDLELALQAALALSPARIHVVGGHGGRLDHLLANALLLAAPAYAAALITAQMGEARLTVVRRRVELTGPPGDLVSLLAVHGPATGVRTTGLRYPLDGDDLHPGSTRGVSNEIWPGSSRLEAAEIGPDLVRATVSLDGGVLVVVQPGRLGPHHEEITR